MKKMILMAVVVVTMMTSCSSYMASGAAFGGMMGSALGGITGGPRGRDMGTLIGMTAGAVAGAAAEAHQQEMAERRARAYYNDDVYRSGAASGRDVEKAKRIQSYHEKVANRGRSYTTRGYTVNNQGYTVNGNTGEVVGNGNGNGYRVERVDANSMPVASTDGQTVSNETKDLTQRGADDKSGFVKDGKYDDRIEMK